MLAKVLVESYAIELQEARANRLNRAKACIKTFGQRGNLTAADASLQFFQAIAIDVVVHIIISLATHALQQQVPIKACLAAELVAIEGRIRPACTIVLHPELHTLESTAVDFIKVVLYLLHLLVGGCRLHLLNHRLGQFQSCGL